MATREDILQDILNLKGRNFLLELPTGTGKSRLALEKVKQFNGNSLLIVVNRIVHKQMWLDEIDKWWSSFDKRKLTITTYASIQKHKGYYDCAIFDEIHHLSERCQMELKGFSIKHSILCSATIGRDLRYNLKILFPGLIVYKKSLRTVIEDNILPDPRVILIPLTLSLTETCTIIKNEKLKGTPIYCNYSNRWKYIKQKSSPVVIKCNQLQYIEELNSQIKWFKNQFFEHRLNRYKAKWLYLCNERLRWLSELKTPIVSELLNKLENYRTLTFCNNIKQTEKLGKYCINSNNKNSNEYLYKFNQGEINHITACNVLNEGMNLVDCQIGIYANLNSSETIVKQRTGRLLRHKSPIIIIPFFKETRDEELVNKMLENYNKELVEILELKDFKI